MSAHRELSQRRDCRLQERYALCLSGPVDTNHGAICVFRHHLPQGLHPSWQGPARSRAVRRSSSEMMIVRPTEKRVSTSQKYAGVLQVIMYSFARALACSSRQTLSSTLDGRRQCMLLGRHCLLALSSCSVSACFWKSALTNMLLQKARVLSSWIV